MLWKITTHFCVFSRKINTFASFLSNNLKIVKKSNTAAVRIYLLHEISRDKDILFAKKNE